MMFRPTARDRWCIRGLLAALLFSAGALSAVGQSPTYGGGFTPGAGPATALPPPAEPLPPPRYAPPGNPVQPPGNYAQQPPGYLPPPQYAQPAPMPQNNGPYSGPPNFPAQ